MKKGDLKNNLLIGGIGSLLMITSAATSAAVGDDDASIEHLRRQLQSQQQLLQRQQQQMQRQQEQIDALVNQRRTESQSMSADNEENTGNVDNRHALVNGKTKESESAPAESDIPVTTGSFPGPFMIPGVGLKTKIGGWVQAEAIYSSNAPIGPGPQYGFKVGQTPVEGPSRKSLSETAFATKLAIDSRKDTPYGKLKLFVEGNFYGSASDNNPVATNQGGFHLLQAYGSLGNFLAGQTWSTFIDLSTQPEINLAYNNSYGVSVIRQTQVRWSQPFSDEFSMDFSLENPYTYAFLGSQPSPPLQTLGDNAPKSNYLPDAVVRANFKKSWGHVSVMGLARQLRISDSQVPGVEDDSAFAYGGKVAGRFNLSPDNYATINVLGGEGIGRYIADFALSGVGDAVVDPQTMELDPLTAYAGTVQFGHSWRDDLTSAFFYSYAGVETKSYQPDNAYDHTQAAGADLFWSVVPHVDVGGVYLYGQRTNKDGNTGHVNQIQAISRFYF